MADLAEGEAVGLSAWADEGDLEGALSDRAGLADELVYPLLRKNASPELNPGIEFFSWVRRMVADAYYTSPIGIKELGYRGNSAMTEFQVPKEAIDYALKRSPLA